MEIVIYWRQRVDYGEQSVTTCLVLKFACCVAGPSEFFIQRFSIERSRTASPVAVLQRARIGLTHWGWMTHICVSKLTTIGSDNALLPGPRQAIIWTNAGILLIGPLGTNFSENLIEIYAFSFRKMHLKISSGKWQPFCLSPSVLINPMVLCVCHFLSLCFEFIHGLAYFC